MKDRDIVIVGQQPWDTEIGSNCKDIAKVFSLQNRVLYVNSPLDRISSIKSKNDPRIRKRMDVIAGKQEGLIKLAPNMWNFFPDRMVESINWMSNKWVFDRLNRLNNSRFAASIKKALEELGFRDFILFNDNEIIKCHYLIEFLRPAKSVYYSRDYIVAAPYWKKHATWLEPRLIAKYDVCVANSSYLTEYCRQYNKNAHYVGQGCDFSQFALDNDFVIPADLRHVKTPMIGYVGALHSMRLDIGLIEELAINRPNWTIVLVGPEDDVFSKSSLHGLDNVLFMGLKSVSELAAYMKAFHVCLNPQAINDLTIGNYPRKIDEYLAMGKPVVATRTKAMESFEDMVYLADDKTQYPALIEQAMAEDSPQLQVARSDFARNHTWENSVEEIYRAID